MGLGFLVAEETNMSMRGRMNKWRRHECAPTSTRSSSSWLRRAGVNGRRYASLMVVRGYKRDFNMTRRRGRGLARRRVARRLCLRCIRCLPLPCGWLGVSFTSMAVAMNYTTQLHACIYLRSTRSYLVQAHTHWHHLYMYAYQQQRRRWWKAGGR
jgi:hypothetical protein